MTLTIQLTPEEEARVRREAAAHGLDAQEYVRLKVLAPDESKTQSTAQEETLPTTGAEALAYWKREGVLGLFSDRPDSPAFARELRRQAETRGDLPSARPETQDQ